jgi:hypothetical protein
MACKNMGRRKASHEAGDKRGAPRKGVGSETRRMAREWARRRKKAGKNKSRAR